MTDGRFARAPRWHVATAATAALVAVGVLTGEAAFLLGGVVALAYVAMVNATGVSEAAVVVHREVEPERPMPGDEVAVRVDVENVGESVLPDLRVVDGVPAKLEVVEGSPRAAIGLRPGRSASFEYAVVAKRGEHAFGPPRVRARSLTGSDVYTGAADQEGDRGIRCELPLEELPLRAQTVEFFGQVQTDTPGSGIEFHSTREYRPGDRLTRINWRRYAETGELTTVEFREARSATVVLVVDARDPSDVAPSAGRPSAIEYALYAADRAVPPLRAAGNRVGVTAIGAAVDWVEPSSSRSVDRRMDEVADAVDPRGGGRGGSADGGGTTSTGTDIGTDTDTGTDTGTNTDTGRRRRERAGRRGRGDAGDAARQLCKQLPPAAQVVLLSPAVDEGPVDAARVFGAYGHAVTVLSPDPTTGGTPGQRLASVRRQARLVRLREADARVVDWDPDDPLSIALGEALRRWVDR